MKTNVAKKLLAASISCFSLVGFSACGNEDSEESSGPAEVSEDIPAEYDLSSDCPEEVVVQMGWKPESEYGAIWNLLGDDYNIDTDKKETTATLTMDGYKTGVKLTIRNVPSSQTAAAIGYVNQDTLLTFMNTDQAIASDASGQPYISVIAPSKKSPQMIMWDPETYPDVKTVKDLGEKGTTILASVGVNWAPLLEQQGIISDSQIDTSYTGDPARFVSDPTIAQQGYSTSEPYIYEHEVEAWGKPVAYDMLYDYGYTIYNETYAVRSGDLEKNRACLTKLVPIIQQSAVDFQDDGASAIKVIVEAVEKYNDGWEYSEGLGTYSWEQMKEQGISGNEDGVAGNLNMDRVQEVLDTFTPILKSSGVEVRSDLTADDLATDEFIDESIKYPES